MAVPVWSGVSLSSTGRKLLRIVEILVGSQSGYYITSGSRNTNDFHGQGLAIDIGFGGVNAAGSARGRDLAAKLYKHSGNTLELIHTTPYSTDNGFYVKNGSKVGPGFYGSATNNAHRDHVHFAATSAQADRILAALGSGGGSSPSPAPAPAGPAQSTVAVMPYGKRATIRKGSSGGTVGHLQFLLRDRLGYVIDKVSGSPFGPQTESAVKDFESKQSGWTVDGVVTGNTFARLERRAAQAVSAAGRPDIRAGSKGMWVGYAQAVLRDTFGQKIDDLQGFPFGPQTTAALKALAKKYPWIPDNGAIGERAWTVLDALDRGRTPKNPDAGAPEPTPEPEPEPEPQPEPGPSYNDTVKPIYGWDASDFDHNRGMRVSHITSAKAQGITFFTHKVTEGTRTVHVHAGAKLKHAASIGIPFVGPYVVTRTPGNNGHGSVSDQVNFAIAEITRQWPQWKEFPGFFWQVDLEHWSYDHVGVTHGVQMANLLESRTNRRAVFYAPRWSYGNTIPGPWNAREWNSHYVGGGGFKSIYPGSGHAGWAPMNGKRPIILQYSSTATIGGQGTTDANAFEGSAADFAELIAAGPGTTPEPDQSTVANMPYPARPTIRRGDSGGAVGHLQFLLRDRLGYVIDKVSGSPFGPQTETAVKDFESKQSGWNVDGVVTGNTFARLERRAAQKISVGNRPIEKMGSGGMWVGYIQSVLQDSNAAQIDDFQGFPFGPQTDKAVRDFQRKYGLTVDGIVASKTWEAIDKLDLGTLPAPTEPTPEPTDPGGEAPPNLVSMKDGVLAAADDHGLAGVSFCGIAPADEDAYGYHNSRARHEAGFTRDGADDYSIQVPLDKLGDPLHFAGLDLCGAAANRVITARVKAAIESGDPRIRALREFYGSLDNEVVFGRTHSSLDGEWSESDADDSHLTHAHFSFFRAFANDVAALSDVRDVVLDVPAEAESPAESPVESPGETVADQIAALKEDVVLLAQAAESLTVALADIIARLNQIEEEL